MTGTMTNNKNHSVSRYQISILIFQLWTFLETICNFLNLSIWHIYDQIINTDPAFINLFENAENLVKY